MLAQICPMTTLTVVNVDAMARPAAPSARRPASTTADAAHDRAKSRKSSARLEQFRANWQPILARTCRTGDPKSRPGGPPSGQPGSPAGGAHQRSPNVAVCAALVNVDAIGLRRVRGV